MNVKRSFRTRSTDPATAPRSTRLRLERSRKRFISALAIAGLIATGGAVYTAVVPAQSASAVDLGNGIITSFEIDGDTDGDGQLDWRNVVGSTPTAPYTAGAGQSTGILDAQRSWDSGTTPADVNGGAKGTCGATETLSVFPGGAKVNDDPWKALITNSANAKGDACTGGSAYEVVTVNGVPHTIFYAYWTRLSGNGDMTSYEIFQGPAAGRADDYLIEFNYDPSSGTSVRVLGWNGSAWVSTGDPVVYKAAVGGNTDTNTSGNDATFGEMAVDLTASGLLPAGGTCRTFLDAGFITRTGNNDTATLQDMLASTDPITLSNCGNLVVKKVGTAGGPDATFSYTVNRTGGGQVHDGTLTGTVADTVAGNNGLGAAIKIGDTHTWGNVFAGNDYKLTEAAPPSPWAFKQTTCSVTNPTTNQVETTTNGGFAMYVGATTTCTIENVTSAVKVTKVAQGDAATFDFTVTGQQGTVQVPGNSSSQVFYYTPGSTVDITEIAEPGDPAWKLQSIACTPQGGAYQTDVPTGKASVQTVAGQVIECTFTNRQDGQIKIIKKVQGDGGEFHFTGNWNGGVTPTLTPGENGSDEVLYTSVTPGTYSVQELTPAPEYDVTALTCAGDVADDTSSGNVATGVGTIDLDPGELVTCTYTNTQRGDLTVIKQTIPDGATQSFDFTLTDQTNFSLTDGGSKAFDNIKPKTYTLEEVNLPDGWKVDNISCAVDGGVPSQTTAAKRDVVVGIGQSVVCTVTNEATKGKLVVEKHVENVPDGVAWGPFSLSLSDAPASEQNPQTVDSTDATAEWDNLVVGKTYTITETVPDGWTLKSFTCNVTDQDGDPNNASVTFTVTPGLVVECDITNTAKPGEVTLEKKVEGIAPGFAWSFDFTISPADQVTPSAKQTVSGTGNSTESITWKNLTVGHVYTITETPKAGWDSSAVECGEDVDPNTPGDQFRVTPGFTLTCTATNTAKPATAKVTKTAIGADGTFTFVLTPLAPAGDPVEQSVSVDAGQSGSTTFTALVPGTKYSIAEKDPGAGWTAGALVCKVKAVGSDTWTDIDETGFTVQPGDTFECTITNTAKATIVIVKNIDGDDATFNFTGTWLDPQAFTITTVNGTESNTYNDVLPGTYQVTELLTTAHVGALQCTDPDQGSSVAGLVGTIDLDPGETVVCTYSNTQLGKIIVDKVVPGVGSIPGGATQVFDFEFGDDPFTLTDGADPFESGLLVPGEYTVEELAEANWHLTGLQCPVGEGDKSTVEIDGSVATIDLAAGDVVHCTYTNAPDTGDLTVRKTVDGVPQGYDFEFEIFLAGGTPPSQKVTDEDPSVSWSDLVVGQTYTLTEGDVGGWNEGDFICNSGSLKDADDELAGFQFVVTPGLSISCTIENTAVPGKVTVEKGVSGVPEDFDWSFQLAISPTEGVEGDSPQTVSGTGDVTDTATWSNLAIGQQYVITELPVPAGWTGGEITCSVGGDPLTDENGDEAGFAFTATPGLEVACELTNKVIPPTGLIEKHLTSIAQQTDGTWDLEYEVTVENQSPVAPLVYDLRDEPQFGAGVVINEASATGPADSSAASWDPIGDPADFVLADDTSVPASQTDTYEITINATVPAEVYETGQDQCQEGDNGGFRNTAWLTVGHGEPQPATDCDVPGRTTIEKSLDGQPVRDAVTGDWTVKYNVVVTNQSDLRDQYYDLSDDLGFPAGVEIVSATATTDAPSTGSVDVADWNGDTVTALADDAPIAKSAVHTYKITVVADVDEITDIDDVQCVESTSGKGFFNEVTLDNGTITTTDDACATPPVGRITLMKHVDLSAFEGIDPADLGLGDGVVQLAAKDWLLTGEGLLKGIAELGDQGLVFTVPTGDYTLDEEPTAMAAGHPLLKYFFSQGWSCDDETPAGDTATVSLGKLTSCDLTNKAELADVGIEKSYDLGDDPDGYIEQGDTFDFVLKVTNHSTVPVAGLDVTDVIDSELVVAGDPVFDGPGTWTETGTTGDNDFAAHGDGPFAPGDVITITIPVTLPAAPVETPDVVGPDDPAPTVEPVDLDDVPNEACVAITDGEGVLPDLIERNNCDSVEVPKKAIDSGAYVRCVADVPWLYYDIQVSDGVEPGDITVTWTSADGTLTKTQTIAWDEREGKLLWPGAAVDENGVPYEFPGWRPITEEDLINPPTPGTRFGDLILDETVPTYPWRDMENPATITFSINPSQSVLAVYPQALPACAIDRTPDVSIVKEASVTQAKPGTSFDYTLSVSTTGTGSAEPVEIFDEIPSELKVTDITTAGSPTFPRWQDCEVTGQDSDGYGGTLHCDLLGVLGPDYPEAPDIVLDVSVDPGTTSTEVENTGEVCWQNADDTSDDPAVLCDDDSVTVTIPQPQPSMPATGFGGSPFIWGAAGLVILGGLLVAAGVVIRRRKHGTPSA